MNSNKYSELMSLNDDLIKIFENIKENLIKKHKEEYDITNVIEHKYDRIIYELKDCKYLLIENY